MRPIVSDIEAAEADDEKPRVENSVGIANGIHTKR